MMSKIRFFASLVVLSFLSGCASVYYLEGKQYKDEASFQKAADQIIQDNLSGITRLPSPLAEKNLIFVVPGEKAIYEESLRRHTVSTGTAPVGIVLDQYRNLSLHASKSFKNFYDVLVKRGVYREVKFVETDSLVNSMEASDGYDVLYFTEPSVASGQYFYVSMKHGKQIFAFDRSGSTPLAKTQAFVDAVQVFAIRE
jgi:uncharacterized protein YceK